MSTTPEPVTWGELPDDVEIDDNDEVEEVDPPDYAELGEHLIATNLEFEKSENYDAEDVVEGGA